MLFRSRDGRRIFYDLLRAGVIVRPLGGYGLPSHLRITVGLPDENRRVLTALADLVSVGCIAKA